MNEDLIAMLADDRAEQYLISGAEEDKLRAQESTWDSENELLDDESDDLKW